MLKINLHTRATSGERGGKPAIKIRSKNSRSIVSVIIYHKHIDKQITDDASTIF